MIGIVKANATTPQKNRMGNADSTLQNQQPYQCMKNFLTALEDDIGERVPLCTPDHAHQWVLNIGTLSLENAQSSERVCLKLSVSENESSYVAFTGEWNDGTPFVLFLSYAGLSKLGKERFYCAAYFYSKLQKSGWSKNSIFCVPKTNSAFVYTKPIQQ